MPCFIFGYHCVHLGERPIRPYCLILMLHSVLQSDYLNFAIVRNSRRAISDEVDRAVRLRFKRIDRHDGDVPNVARPASIWRSPFPREGSEADSYCTRSLEPASPAIPTAAPDKQHYDDDDQKGCGIHIVLLGVYSGPSPAHKLLLSGLN